MKKIIILCLSLLLFKISSGQETWQLSNPQPSGYTLNDIHFVSIDTGFFINNSEVFITTNQGEKWKKLPNIKGGNDINFKGATGFIVGDKGHIIKSIDNGKTWGKVELNGYSTTNFSKIEIKSKDTVIIYYPLKMLKSNDGGYNWNVFDNDYSQPYTKHIINESIGYAIKDDKIIKTTNGGLTWVEISSKPYVTERTFFFVNEQIGFIGGIGGAMFKTIDGGLTWQWASYRNGYGDDSFTINTVFFLNDSVGFSVGALGRIMKTTDGCKSWVSYSPCYNDISDINFPTNNTGFCATGSNLMKTTDGGSNWFLTAESGGSKVCFLNENIGFSIAGSSLRKTINGGDSWSNIDLNNLLLNESLSSLCFINIDTGFVSGGFNTKGLLRTYDGGENWEKIYSELFKDIQFVTSSVGYARSNSKLHKTIDGGESWNKVFELSSDLNSFHFINENTGFLVGEANKAYKTTNGGSDWVIMDVDQNRCDFKAVQFFNDNIGYISGESNYTIKIYKSIDGGLEWIREETPYISDPMGLPSISITKNGTVYIGGANGIVLKSYVSDIHLATNPQINVTTHNFSIHPNPANDYIKVNIDNQLQYKVQIFNTQGKLIKTVLMQDEQIDISSLETGLYIISYTIDNVVYTGKLIKE